MVRKCVFLTVVFLLLLKPCSRLRAAEETAALRIYLPRETMIEADVVELGRIALVRGEKALVDKAASVSLGRFALTGQQIVIDKLTVLSRLASAGIENDQVKLTGAEKITIRRNEKRIESQRFVDIALEFLKAQGLPKWEGELHLIRQPDYWVMPAHSRAIELVPEMGKYTSTSKLDVWISVIENGEKIGDRKVLFSVTYPCRQAVARHEISKGTVLTSDNVEIEDFQGGKPQRQEWQPPYGLVASQTIRGGRIINDRVTERPKPPLMIENRQNVVLKLETSGLLVTSVGQALQDGRVGELIRVRTENGRGRVILGKVQPDGTVQPML